jgi:hypothetical protein
MSVHEEIMFNRCYEVENNILKTEPNSLTAWIMNPPLQKLDIFFGLVAVLSRFKWFKLVEPWFRSLASLMYRLIFKSLVEKLYDLKMYIIDLPHED